MSKIQVKNIQTVDISPKIKNPKYAELVPKTLFPKHFSFEVIGGNNAVCNGIRRTISSECMVRTMSFEFDSFDCNNPFTLNDMILTRLMLIPIDQTTPLDAVFEIDIINKTKNILDVKASDIKIVNPGTPGLKKLPFNELFTLMTLEPNKYIKIKSITIKNGFGYNHAAYSFACNTACVVLDEIPINNIDPETKGISSSVSDPHHHKISFNTNGTLPPQTIVFEACDNLSLRLEYIIKLLPNIISSGDIYVLTINGESDTIGCILMKTITVLYPQIIAVNYSTGDVLRSLTMRVRTDEDINEVFTHCIRHVVRQITDIKKSFE